MPDFGKPRDVFGQSQSDDTRGARDLYLSPMMLGWAGTRVDARGQVSIEKKGQFFMDTVFPYLLGRNHPKALALQQALQDPESFVRDVMVPDMQDRDKHDLASRCLANIADARNMVINWVLQELLMAYGDAKCRESGMTGVDVVMNDRAAARAMGITPAMPQMHETYGMLADITAMVEAAKAKLDADTRKPVGIPSLVDRILRMLKFAISFSATESSASQFVVLPESVRCALRYKDGMFGKAEILAMNSPHFEGLSVYLALKFFSQRPELQKSLLERILLAIRVGDGYNSVNNVIREQISASPNDMGPVNGVKVAQVCRQGPHLFEERFAEIAHHLRRNAQTPCLIANASLIGLAPFVRAMRDGDDLIILYPDDLGKESVRGYYILRWGDGFQVEELTLEHFERGNFVGVVDDTRKSGQTFDMVTRFVIDSTRSRVGEIKSVVG